MKSILTLLIFLSPLLSFADNFPTVSCTSNKGEEVLLLSEEGEAAISYSQKIETSNKKVQTSSSFPVTDCAFTINKEGIVREMLCLQPDSTLGPFVNLGFENPTIRLSLNIDTGKYDMQREIGNSRVPGVVDPIKIAENLSCNFE